MIKKKHSVYIQIYNIKSSRNEVTWIEEKQRVKR